VINSGQEGPLEQHNHGPGTFIGRDNYGPISYEMLDRQTRSMLAKLSKEAPPLAALLTKALRDGIISPDVANALMLAVRNINEDVANALMLAGRNINEDVADMLMLAGRNINADVAEKFVRVNQELSDTARDLDTIKSSLNEAVRQANELHGDSNSGYRFGPPRSVTGPTRYTARDVTRPSLKIPDNWRFRFKLIFWSFVVGLAIGAALVYHFKR
jgi:hypothetical protein